MPKWFDKLKRKIVGVTIMEGNQINTAKLQEGDIVTLACGEEFLVKRVEHGKELTSVLLRDIYTTHENEPLYDEEGSHYGWHSYYNGGSYIQDKPTDRDIVKVTRGADFELRSFPQLKSGYIVEYDYCGRNVEIIVVDAQYKRDLPSKISVVGRYTTSKEMTYIYLTYGEVDTFSIRSIIKVYNSDQECIYDRNKYYSEKHEEEKQQIGFGLF